MAASLRDLRRKIKSITGTQKITSAMQMVAASKMSRAVARATSSRPYAEHAMAMVSRLSSAVDSTSQPLFAVRPSKRRLVLLVTTNRGLAGSLNTQLLRRFAEWQTSEARDADVKVVAVGAKGRNWLLRYAREQLKADFPAPDAIPDFADIRPIAQLLIDEFLANRTDEVYLAYSHFVSTLRQEPRIIRFLPFAAEASEASDTPASDHMFFEPSKREILEALVPRVLRARLYQVLLETHASEQSARMLAMKNATDNAGDLISDLTLTYNGFRQAAITGELLDIAAGAAALEGN